MMGLLNVDFPRSLVLTSEQHCQSKDDAYPVFPIHRLAIFASDQHDSSSFIERDFTGDQLDTTGCKTSPINCEWPTFTRG
jgi:hypothetical protein